MPAFKNFLNRAFSLILISHLLIGQVASPVMARETAQEGTHEKQEPLHWSGNKTRWDRKTNKVELFGNAAVHQPGETMTANYILLDLEDRTIYAKGNVVYIASEVVIYGDEMYFNMETRTGSIVDGRVSTDSFTLSGERINKLGPKRYQTYRGEYTTCHDCPHAWTLRADDVDLTFEGYAHMKNVTGTIKQAPFFWVPYLVVPVKTRRQTGFLFPEFGYAQGGFRFLLPFFWAASRSADMTIGVGEYGGHGSRVEWEGRYQLTKRSGGTMQLNYLRDREFPERPNRWNLQISQTQELPFGIEQKLRVVEISDNLYPSTFGDVPIGDDAFVSSDLIFSHTTDQVSTTVAARRFRDLLYLGSPTGFDPDTVQLYPSFTVSTNDKFLLHDPTIVGGLTLGVSHFTRASGAFDRNPFVSDADRTTELCPDGEFPCFGIDPIREATRISVTPTLYTALKPGDAFSLVPSAEYRAYFYRFPAGIPNLSRGYLLFQTDFSTQLERTFDTSHPGLIGGILGGSPDVPRMKHLIRPTLTYSYIPLINEPSEHPFLDQIEFGRERGFSGFTFDNNDVVPLDSSRTYTNYFVPLGHSLTYGFTTQVLRRYGALDAPEPTYGRAIELRAGQTINFREFRDEIPVEDRQPLSRFFSSLDLNFSNFAGSVDYVYVPYVPITETTRRNVWTASLSYILERSTRQMILPFDRSISLSYYYNKLDSQTNYFAGRLNFSLNDSLLPTAFASYDLISKRFLEFGGGLKFSSAGSRCYQLEIGAKFELCPEERGFCVQEPKINLQLNWTGEGFGGVQSLGG